MLASVPFALVFPLTVLLSLYSEHVICLTNHGLEIIPERAEMTYTNDKYVRNVQYYIRRAGRKHPYTINAVADVLQTWTNNVSISMILYEYLHNEYKPSFIEFHFKLCDFINKDDLIGSSVRLYGVTCPVKPGHWNITNGRLLYPIFPYVFPFKKTKVVAMLNVTATGEVIAIGALYAYIKQML